MKDNKINELMQSSYDKAKELSSRFIHLEHVLKIVMENQTFLKVLKRHKIDTNRIMKEIDEFLTKFPFIDHIENSGEKIELSKPVQVFLGHYKLCYACNKDVIEDKDMMFVINIIASFLFMEDTFAQKMLMANGVDMQFLALLYQDHSGNELSDRIASTIHGIDEQSMKDKEEDFINQYLINLTEKVTQNDFIDIVGREKELELLQQVMLRHDKPNAIIVGNPGVGKTKLVEGLAKIYSKKYSDKVFYQLDTLSFMSNILLKGELENRVKNLYQIIQKRGNVILFIDEIHTICGNSDSSSQSDVSSLLKPLLNDGTLKIIGTTTFEEYRKYIEKDSAFMRRFFRMTVEEPTLEETKNILMVIKKSYEEVFKVQYSEEMIDLIIDSCNKYFSNRAFPDKAIDIIDTVGAYALYNNETTITDQMVYRTLSMLLNIPLSNISQSEEDLYQHLEENIKKEIIGQDEAVKKVSDAVIISRSGLRETNKTATSLMFKGSSGVGKTEICKVLSKIMNIPLVRFDMSEYMEDHSVSKLIGSPPGYKGFSDGKAGNGLLINEIDEHPNCILLLDEIEKANSKIHNILLQVMDNGQLTSSSGKSVSFEHVYLIMTSNVGSYNSHKIKIGFGNDKGKSVSDKDYEDKFLPEFRNRIDSTVTFNDLPRNVLQNICRKFLDELKDLLTKKSVDFFYNDDIVNHIVDKVENSGNGARPMKHIITNEIKNVIAKELVFGKYKNGGKVVLSIENDDIVFGE